jgi:hypothetical protein
LFADALTLITAWKANPKLVLNDVIGIMQYLFDTIVAEAPLQLVVSSSHELLAAFISIL